MNRRHFFALTTTLSTSGLLAHVGPTRGRQDSEDSDWRMAIEEVAVGRSWAEDPIEYERYRSGALIFNELAFLYGEPSGYESDRSVVESVLPASFESFLQIDEPDVFARRNEGAIVGALSQLLADNMEAYVGWLEGLGVSWSGPLSQVLLRGQALAAVARLAVYSSGAAFGGGSPSRSAEGLAQFLEVGFCFFPFCPVGD